jgi:uncharacterized protein with HEPN domain
MTSAAELRVLDYLGHMRQAIERIRRYTKGKDRAAFLGDEMAQDAVIRNIEILGESARNIERHAPQFAARHSHVPWGDIYLMRNRVSHGYFSVDLDVVWTTLQRDIPELANQVDELIREIGP